LNRYHSDQHVWIGAYASQKDGCFPGGLLGVPCSDSITLQTPEVCGVPATDIVVSIMAFRGKYGSDGTGVIPLTMITVTDFAHFQAGSLKMALDKTSSQDQFKSEPSLSRISGKFSELGLPAVKAVADMIQTYTQDKRLQLSHTLGKLHAGQPLAEPDRQLMSEIAAGVEKEHL